MTTTPEGRVKAKIRQILAEYDGLYSHWPVPTGFGRRTIDCFGCYRGRFFGIEVKAPGKKPTLNQTKTLQQIGGAMGKTFVIDNVDSPVLAELRAWLDELRGAIRDNPYLPPDEVHRHPV